MHVISANRSHVIQPDVTWCGGLTELLRIAAYADACSVPVLPHGSSVYSYHSMAARASSAYTDFELLAPAADELVPMFAPLLRDEPVPEHGVLRVPDRAGFGVERDRGLAFERPCPR